MTISLVRQSFIQVQRPERDKQKKTKTPQLFFLTKLCMKIEDIRAIFAPLPLIFQSGQ